MKRTNFLTAALEELQQGQDVETLETGKDVSSVKTDGKTPGDAVAEVTVDGGADAVAELMEKNATLESECFDNDLDIMKSSSDSVEQDFNEAVQAGAALENLAHTVDLAIKAGQVNHASVAGFYMAFEQICDRVNLRNPVAAMEDDTLRLAGPEGQAKAIGDGAMDKAKELAGRLVDGIKKVIGWLLNFVRQIIGRVQDLGERARKAQDLVNSIDESKTIDSKPFIASLRLVEGGGDPTKQFVDYGKMASKSLYGFFNDSFGTEMMKVFTDARDSGHKHEDSQLFAEAHKRLTDMIRTLLSVVYTEHGMPSDVSANIPSTFNVKDLTVGKTEPCVGGIQLYLAATLDGTPEEMAKYWYCAAGVVKTAPKLEAPDSIPVVRKHDAKAMLGVIEKWMKDQKVLESGLRSMQIINLRGHVTLDLATVRMYLSTLTALASGCIPHLLRMNTYNAANFIAYVEKSAAVSKAAPKAE